MSMGKLIPHLTVRVSLLQGVGDCNWFCFHLHVWDVWDLNVATVSSGKSGTTKDRLFFMPCPELLYHELLRKSHFTLQIAVF